MLSSDAWPDMSFSSVKQRSTIMWTTIIKMKPFEAKQKINNIKPQDSWVSSLQNLAQLNMNYYYLTGHSVDAGFIYPHDKLYFISLDLLKRS